MVEFNGKKVRTSEQFLGELRGSSPARRSPCKIQRGEQTEEVPVTIGEKP